MQIDGKNDASLRKLFLSQTDSHPDVSYVIDMRFGSTCRMPFTQELARTFVIDVLSLVLLSIQDICLSNNDRSTRTFLEL